MSKIVIEEILHLFDRNIYLKQDWKQGQGLFFAAVATTNAGRSAGSIRVEKNGCGGFCIHWSGVMWWEKIWVRSDSFTANLPTLTQHLVQWGSGSYQRSHKAAQSTVLLWGKAFTSAVFAHFSVIPNVTLCKTHTSWLWVNYYFMKMWHHYSKIFIYLFLYYAFFFLICRSFVEYPLFNLFHSAFFPQMFLK